MKYTSATNVFLFASIASSLISWGSAVPRPGPAGKVLQPSKTRNDSRASSSSPSTGLLVDQEGNLYSPRVSKTNNRRKELVCVRGGALCVDGEGNFYTPKDTSAIVAERNNLRDDTSSSSSPPLSRSKTSASTSPSSILRGGSNNHNIGGLGVDIEGNLFATQGRTSATPSSSAAALLLRGGDLNVDNEGNFYYPRFPAVKKPTITSYRRRGAHDTVLLTKKTTTAVSNSSGSCSDRVKTKKPSSQDDPMAFIGYNNALMET